jgi:DegV family protein with EDD domain
MSKVAIVTDSSAYIPAEMTEGLPVFSLPLHLSWGKESYRDAVDITPEQFYPRLKSERTMPQTSQITPQEFSQLYQKLLEKGFEILSIHLSGKLTNTLTSALQAKNMLAEKRIELVDSESGAMGMGFQVLAAARAAVGGAVLKECKEIAEQARQHTNIFFIPGSLEFLRRGGRIGGATAFLGSMLQMKPILETRSGLIEAVDRVRTMNRAIERMIDLIEQRIGNSNSLYLASMHILLPDKAVEVLEKARQRLGPERIVETTITTVSPVIGTHIGPDSIGIAYMTGF